MPCMKNEILVVNMLRNDTIHHKYKSNTNQFNFNGTCHLLRSNFLLYTMKHVVIFHETKEYVYFLSIYVLQ